jgi:hypothetical protein
MSHQFLRRVIVILAAVLIAVPVVLGGCGRPKDVSMIEERLKAYALVDLRADTSHLDANQQKVLMHLVEAAKAVDPAFWHQSAHDALAAKAELESSKHPEDKTILEYLMINYGPYDRRFENERFYGEGGPKPDGAGFYPHDLTKEEFEAYITAHPEVKEDFEKLNTLIKRRGTELVAVPYEEEYRIHLEKASAALRQASRYADNPSLKRYLSLRADALLSGDFYESDMAWMDLEDNLLDTVIGPIEVYEDQLMGLKASYEANVMIKDPIESARLDIYKNYLNRLEHALPIDEKYKRDSVGMGNKLEIVNVAYFAADFNAGIKTIAASLPNDERVIEAKGAKKQIYRNVLGAKFNMILKPIAEVLVDPEQLDWVSEESFITNTMQHEISHTLGPTHVYGNEDLTIRKALQERYSRIEECVADIVGIHNSAYFQKVDVFTEDQVRRNYVTYLGGIFRSIRFGTESAHAKGMAMQLNYLLKEGGIEYNTTTEKYRVNFQKFPEAADKLAREVLTIEATGDYEKAGEMLATYGELTPQTLASLDKLADIPVDVRFTYAY